MAAFQRNTTKWAARVGLEPLINTFYMEYMLAYRNSAQQLSNVVVVEAYGAPADKHTTIMTIYPYKPWENSVPKSNWDGLFSEIGVNPKHNQQRPVENQTKKVKHQKEVEGKEHSI